MTDEEILEKTKEYYCYGEDEADLKARIKYASVQKPGSVAVDFGTGNGRTAFIMCMANPDLKVFTFDHGRKDVSNEELLSRTIERAEKLGIKNLDMAIGDATKIIPQTEVSILNIDIEDGYDQAKKIAENWFPQVRKGGVIFIQTYDMGKYPEMRRAFEEYFKENWNDYVVGKQYGNTRAILKI